MSTAGRREKRIMEKGSGGTCSGPETDAMDGCGVKTRQLCQAK